MSPSPDPPNDSRGSSPEPDSIEFEAMPTASADGGESSRAASPIQPALEMPSSTGANGSIPRGASRIVGVLGFLLFLPCIAGLLWMMLPGIFRIEAGLKYPYQLDAEEGFVHLQGVDLLEGRSIYSPIDKEPYLVGNYPPGYPAMVAVALKAGATGLPAGRIVVALASALIGVLLLSIGRLVSSRWSAALLAPLLFYVSYEFYTWAPFSRVDLPALALTLAGILTFTRGSSRPAGLVLSALWFVAAAYTRQTAILAPIACSFALLMTDRRRLGWFLVPYLGLGLGAFLILNLLLEGEFWNHLVVYNRNTMNWSVFRSVLKNEIWFFYRWWIVAMLVGSCAALLVGAVEFAHDRKENSSSRFPWGMQGILVTGYFLLSSLSLAAFAKSGSAANYALEPLAASALFLAYLIGRLMEGSSGLYPTGSRLLSVAGLLVVSICLFLHVGRILPINWTETLSFGKTESGIGAYLDEHCVGWALFSSSNPTREEIARGDRIVAEIRETRGDVLSEHPIYAIEAGRTVMFQPFIMTTLAREGQWDPDPFLMDLRRGRFGLIVTTQDLRDARRGGVLARYTESMADAILDRYELREVFPPGPLGIPTFVWRPRPEAPGS